MNYSMQLSQSELDIILLKRVLKGDFDMDDDKLHQLKSHHKDICIKIYNKAINTIELEIGYVNSELSPRDVLQLDRSRKVLDLINKIIEKNHKDE